MTSGEPIDRAAASIVGKVKNPSTALTAPAGGKARATYESLLAAGERVLRAAGTPGLTSTAVAAEAGLATGTFYTYFADKDALLAALFDRRLEDLTAAVAEVLGEGAATRDGLEASLRQAVGRVLHGYRAHSTVLRAALGRIPDSALLRAVYWRRHEQAVAAVERFVRDGQRAGVVRAGHPDELALAMLVVVQGLNHPVALAAPTGQARAITAHLTRSLVALLAPDRDGSAP